MPRPALMLAAILAQRVHAVAAPREDLVRVGLVRHVPDEAVVRGVEDVVQRNGELDDAQRRAQVAARGRHGAQHVPAQLVRQRAQIGGAQAAQIGRRRDGVQQRGGARSAELGRRLGRAAHQLGLAARRRRAHGAPVEARREGGGARRRRRKQSGHERARALGAGHGRHGVSCGCAGAVAQKGSSA
ncbi:1-deoxyxylulose-5-phosphate synthase [Gracilaria domingensis]|nr:1-deoxyxylulose-5-phosphate synthase [Gracilaria domingensis]